MLPPELKNIKNILEKGTGAKIDSKKLLQELKVLDALLGQEEVLIHESLKSAPGYCPTCHRKL